MSELIDLKLPERASELIRVALQDLERVENDANYRVDMDQWHHPTGGLCSVCLAGAIMTRVLAPDDDIYGRVCGMFDANSAMRLMALDYLRTGCIRVALDMLCEHSERFEPRRIIVPYDANPQAFREDMLKLADDLERAGL